MVSASDGNLRNAYAKTASILYDQYGIDNGWPGIVPWPVPEAIVDTESGGVNLPENGSGAVGLMQLVPPPNGGEASAYQSATGELVTSEKLTDPAFNLRVGIFGLATDEMRATQMGYPGWHRAGETYFTGGPNNDSAGDGNKTGATYRQGLVDYWRSTFGDWTANYLQKDSWYQRDPSGITMWAGNVDDPTQDSGNQETNQVNKETNYAYTHSQPGGTPVIDVGGIVSGAASALSSVDKVGALYDVLSDTDTWLRVGIVVVGIVGVSVGLFAVTK